VTESGSTAFLQQAHRNNWQQYLVSLRPDAPGGWDLCVLTASDERQAAMYRRQLALRREAGLLPLRTRFLVVADPAGQRIGSGGATLRVLTLLASSAVDSGLNGCSSARLSDLQPPAENDVLTAGRVLVIHSGGDSRRLPHCSATGKLFARIPRALPDGRASTIFDEFLISLSGLAVEMPPGVLVASGDVLLVFDHLQPGFQRPGVIGVAAAAPAEMGTRHGVYVSGRMHNIGAYLHKPSLELMQKWEAIADDGTVAIDTGLIWLDAQTVQTLVALAREETVAAFCSPPAAAGGQEASPRQRQPLTGLNLYGDLLLPLAESTTLAGYLADTSDGPDTPAVPPRWPDTWRTPAMARTPRPFGRRARSFGNTCAASPSRWNVCSRPSFFTLERRRNIGRWWQIRRSWHAPVAGPPIRRRGLWSSFGRAAITATHSL